MSDIDKVKKQGNTVLEFAKNFSHLLGRRNNECLIMKDYFLHFIKKRLIMPYPYDYPFLVKPEILLELEPKIVATTGDDNKENMYRVFIQDSPTEHYDARIVLLAKPPAFDEPRIGLFFSIYSNNPMLSAAQFNERFDEYIDHDFYNAGPKSLGFGGAN